MRWKEKFIFKAGREIFIKMVAQAIPKYSMSLCKLLRSIYDNINSLLAKYWWGKIKMKGRFFGSIRRSYALKKRTEEWAFVIFTLLT